MTKREFAMILFVAAIIYASVVGWPAPDIKTFLGPWIAQIRETGLSSPIGNYSPPYLYFLALTSALPVFLAVKAIAIFGAAWLAFCVSQLAGSVGADRKTVAAFSILLPTVILNAAVLGQCDTIWVGGCVLAVSGALRGHLYKMAFWAGLAFAFKAQAAFLAPFCMACVVQRRAWIATAIAAVTFLAALAPAAIAGWPWRNLLTIYFHQAELNYIGDAPNIWAIPAWLGVHGSDIFVVGYILGAISALVVSAVKPRNLLALALLSSIALPFFLPKMLERSFLLADILSLVSACRDRRNVPLAVLIQTASVASMFSELTKIDWLNAVASIPMFVALLMAIRNVILKAEVLPADGRMQRGCDQVYELASNNDLR